MSIVIIPYFTLLVLKLVNVVVIVIILTIHMQKFVFLTLKKMLKYLNVKVFNLMSRTSETRFIEWNETCKYKCRLDELFVIINNDEIKINVDVNVKN